MKAVVALRSRHVCAALSRRKACPRLISEPFFGPKHRCSCRHCAAAAAAASSELDGLRMRLLEHACTADLVLDLHCCFDASRHLFTLPSQAQVCSTLAMQNDKPLTIPQMFASLSSRLKCAAVLTADISGGNSFDEACSVPWQTLSRLYPHAGFDAETCASCASQTKKMNTFWNASFCDSGPCRHRRIGRYG
jgi:hypothetical protein